MAADTATYSQRISTTPSTMPPGPFAQAYRTGDLIFVSGQVAYDHEKHGPISNDVAEQTLAAAANLRRVLNSAGADLCDVIKLTCILPKLSDHYAAFNAAFTQAFGDLAPARTTIQAGLLGGYLVEIEAIAVRPALPDTEAEGLTI